LKGCSSSGCLVPPKPGKKDKIFLKEVLRKALARNVAAQTYFSTISGVISEHRDGVFVRNEKEGACKGI
jgi:hypothetical protein